MSSFGNVLHIFPVLLSRFLNQSGSWFLLQTWLTEAFESRNTPLLFEILELLQLCPMSETRLKDNVVTTIIQSIAQEFNDQSKFVIREEMKPSLAISLAKTKYEHSNHMICFNSLGGVQVNM